MVERARIAVRFFLQQVPYEYPSDVAPKLLAQIRAWGCGAVYRTNGGWAGLEDPERFFLDHYVKSSHPPDLLYTARKKGAIRKLLTQAVSENSNSAAIAWDACVLLVEGLMLQGDRLPAELQFFAVRTLRGDISRPKPRGRNKNNALRDMAISLAVKCATLEGMRATRRGGDVHPNPCACSIVAEELAHFGLHIDYSTIKGIWYRGPLFTKRD